MRILKVELRQAGGHRTVKGRAWAYSQLSGREEVHAAQGSRALTCLQQPSARARPGSPPSRDLM